MKSKKIYGFVLLALIIMLLPIGMVSAKYKQTKDVGTVILDIAPPVLSPKWKTKLTTATTTLIVDSFTPETDSDRYSSFSWESGTPVGYDSSNKNGFKSNVRLFEDNGTAYILAIGNNPVTFPENSSSLFHDDQWYLSNVEKINFKNINTSNVVDMSNMFIYCAKLKRLDASGFNTSNVEDMSNMFFNCASLTSLDLSNFNTSGVTDMKYMFNTCERLTSLNINSFDTSNVTNMENMFGSCASLPSLDLSNFSISNETNMHNFFTFCSQLKQVTLGGNFKFINYSADTTVLLPGQNFSGANGKWYISNSGQGYNSTDVAVYHNEHKTTTTYYAVQSEAPS